MTTRWQVASEPIFRLWLARCDDWRPSQWSESPPHAVAIEPLESGLFTLQQAQDYLSGFNSALLRQEQHLWGVAIPVTICYQGDASPGAVTVGHRFDSDL